MSVTARHNILSPQGGAYERLLVQAMKRFGNQARSSRSVPTLSHELPDAIPAQLIRRTRPWANKWEEARPTQLQD